MMSLKSLGISCALILCLALHARAANINILHTFTSGATDGRSPTGLLRDGSVLYGTTQLGGLPDAGTVYRLNTDGTGFALLHTFSGPAGDGISPQANLSRDGSTLYGTTAGFGGTVYKIQTNGTGFSTLHQFAWPGTQTSPQAPANGVAVSGSTLYGTTVVGGANAGPQVNPPVAGNGGIVFKLATDGTGFTTMKAFDPTMSDGQTPRTAVTVSGQTIYGMTQGLNPISPNAGTIYKVNTDGTGFTTLKQFSNASPIRPDGAFPAYNGLLLDGNRLYGVTSSGGFESGGGFNAGVVFAIDTDGSNFDVLHTFGATGDGINPRGTLVLDGTTLYGTTFGGGNSGIGTIYQIQTDGSGYQKIHDFAGGPNDGARPFDPGLLIDGNTLYGTTTGGGQFDIGVVYSLTIPEPASASLALMGCLARLASDRRRMRKRWERGTAISPG